MTRKYLKKFLPIMQAYVNGETLQFRQIGFPNSEWTDCNSDDIDFFQDNWEYRVKPIETKYENDKELPDCKFNYGHLENGEWIKKKCHVNCECEFATFGICNDDISDLKVE